MVEVERVGVVSLGVVMGAVYTLLGLLVGLLFGCFALVGFAGLAASLEDVTGFALGSSIVTALFYVVCLPLFYGVLGFIGGVIVALIYNVVASITGGLKLQLRDVGMVKAEY